MEDCISHVSEVGNLEIYVTDEDVATFQHLLDTDSAILRLLRNDVCYILADNYLISMVFTYFKRANLDVEEFTGFNFYAALLLAHDMEEDNPDFQQLLPIWLLGHSNLHKYRNTLLRAKYHLFRAMGFRATVASKCCEEVMGIFPTSSTQWQLRYRADYHGGASRHTVHDHLFNEDDDMYCEDESEWPKTLDCEKCLDRYALHDVTSNPITYYVPEHQCQPQQILLEKQENTQHITNQYSGDYYIYPETTVFCTLDGDTLLTDNQWLVEYSAPYVNPYQPIMYEETPSYASSSQQFNPPGYYLISGNV